ncbi:hypothetical protein KC929_01415 [Patescibacteria group bacterium]|nr:hypothetical protein [Patescibacteria group bacterium]
MKTKKELEEIADRYFLNMDRLKFLFTEYCDNNNRNVIPILEESADHDKPLFDYRILLKKEIDLEFEAGNFDYVDEKGIKWIEYYEENIQHIKLFDTLFVSVKKWNRPSLTEKAFNIIENLGNFPFGVILAIRMNINDKKVKFEKLTQDNGQQEILDRYLKQENPIN